METIYIDGELHKMAQQAILALKSDGWDTREIKVKNQDHSAIIEIPANTNPKLAFLLGFKIMALKKEQQ